MIQHYAGLRLMLELERAICSQCSSDLAIAKQLVTIANRRHRKDEVLEVVARGDEIGVGMVVRCARRKGVSVHGEKRRPSPPYAL